MFQNRIYGLKGAAKKLASQNKSKSPGDEDTESPSGPAHNGNTVAEDASSTSGSPSPESGADSRAEADTK